MSDEQPRMSRREMRAKGLLAPILDGASPLDDLTPTAEIRLKRLTRKEMREREAMEAQSVRPSALPEPTPRKSAGSKPAKSVDSRTVGGDRMAGNDRTADGDRTRERTLPEGSRWRHVEDDPKIVSSFNEPRRSRKAESGVAMPPQRPSEAEVETPEHFDEHLESGAFTHVEAQEREPLGYDDLEETREPPKEPIKPSVFGRFEREGSQASGSAAETPGDGAEDGQDISQASLRAPLLERLHRDAQPDSPGEDYPTGMSANIADSMSTTAMPQMSEPIMGAQEPSDGGIGGTDYNAEFAELLEDEKPRGWLMITIAVLIGLALGVGIGLAGRHFLKSDGVQPALEATVVSHQLPGFSGF